MHAMVGRRRGDEEEGVRVFEEEAGRGEKGEEGARTGGGTNGNLWRHACPIWRSARGALTPITTLPGPAVSGGDLCTLHCTHLSLGLVQKRPWKLDVDVW